MQEGDGTFGSTPHAWHLGARLGCAENLLACLLGELGCARPKLKTMNILIKKFKNHVHERRLKDTILAWLVRQRGVLDVFSSVA